MIPKFVAMPSKLCLLRAWATKLKSRTSNESLGDLVLLKGYDLLYFDLHFLALSANYDFIDSDCLRYSCRRKEANEEEEQRLRFHSICA